MARSAVDDLAAVVGVRLGREVTVHRVRPNGIGVSPSLIRYTLEIEGCPERWYNLTINEAKGWLAMLYGLLCHNVVVPGGHG